MSLIDIALVKKHLRVYADDEDTEIAAYQAAAEAIIVAYLDRSVLGAGVSPLSGDDGTAIEVNPTITAAILLLTGDFYEFREADQSADGDAVLPRAVRALLAPYRVWRTYDECAPVVTVQ